MPIFEYRCLSCSHEFELVILKSSPEPACPSCGSASLEKVLSTFSASSDSTQQRSRHLLGAKNKAQAQKNRAEREFYKTDHHDD